MVEEMCSIPIHFNHTVQLPNAGYDNQSCRILTVIFNRINQLQVIKYNIYSNTLIYTNVTTATALWGCDFTNIDSVVLWACPQNVTKIDQKRQCPQRSFVEFCRQNIILWACPESVAKTF